VQDFFKQRGDSHVLTGLHRIDETGVWFKKPPATSGTSTSGLRG
jgi:hypothetical protein